MLRMDLHLHTVFSGDSAITPKFVVEQLHAHPFFKGVAITDHENLEGYFRIRRLAKAYEDLVILPGIELSTEKGDIIILGVEERPIDCSCLNSVVDFANEIGGTILVPHPYRTLGLGDSAMNIDAHAIEILNPTATSRENMLARELAKARNLPGVAGTDAHSSEELWKVFTQVEAQPDIDSVLDSIKKGLVKAVSSVGLVGENKEGE